MPLRLLLDEHLSPEIAHALTTRGVDARALRDWRGGALLGKRDADILRAAASEERVLVTYDVRTVPRALRELSNAGEHHSGVLAVSMKTVRPQQIGVLVDALALESAERQHLRDQIVFLRVRPR